MLPIFFPQIQRSSTTLDNDFFPLSLAVSAGFWALEHMNVIDPDIKYTRCVHTDGHRWKLYEVHRTHVKKTKFFEPTRGKRFFDDEDHMLSVIGMLRFAMGIRENIVLKSDSYSIDELKPELDPTRTIQRSILSANSERPLLRERH